MKGELLFEFKAKNNSTTIKDIGPNGVQLEMNDHGEVSANTTLDTSTQSASASRPTEPMTIN